MEGAARDSTEEWLLPEAAVPPTIATLEARIDEAIAIARSSEAAAVRVADAAIESAVQASRAADLAKRAAELAAVGQHGGRGPFMRDERMVRFARRADRLGARLARLQRR
jgi:guanyl-specific ribonuclease Sa